MITGQVKLWSNWMEGWTNVVLSVHVLMWVSRRLKLGLQGCSLQDRSAPNFLFGSNSICRFSFLCEVWMVRYCKLMNGCSESCCLEFTVCHQVTSFQLYKFIPTSILSGCFNCIHFHEICCSCLEIFVHLSTELVPHGGISCMTSHYWLNFAVWIHCLDNFCWHYGPWRGQKKECWW
jgi:hypothetical protein